MYVSVPVTENEARVLYEDGVKREFPRQSREACHHLTAFASNYMTHIS